MKSSIIKKVKIYGSLFLLSLLLISCDNKTQEKVERPDGAISPKKAAQLDQNYTNTRYELINKYLGQRARDPKKGKYTQMEMDSLMQADSEKRGFMDNRSSWWSIDEIEAYIAYAKQEAKKNNYLLDGLRIYQGAYNDTVINGKKQIGLATVFIVPTGKKAVGQKGSIFPTIAVKESSDISGVYPLNEGHRGDPPHSSYPQN